MEMASARGVSSIGRFSTACYLPSRCDLLLALLLRVSTIMLDVVRSLGDYALFICRFANVARQWILYADA